MDEQAFIDQLFADPTDDTALVYADWLDEHSQADRAALIRTGLRAQNRDLSEDYYEADGRLGPLTERCTAAFGTLRKKFAFVWDRGLVTATLNAKAKPTEEDLRQLGRFPYVTRLERFEVLTAARLGQLTLCPNLVGLGFTNQQGLTARHWQALAGLPHLRELRLTSTGDGPGMNDADLPHLAGLAGLRELYLTDARISDAGVGELAKLAALEVLDLSGAQVGDEGLAFLPSLRRLRVLRLARTLITDATLARLCDLPALTELDVGETPLDDPIGAVLPLKGLRVLGLSRQDAVNDDNLPQLLALPGLRELDLLKADVTRFRLAQLLPRTPWKKVKVGIRSNHDYAEGRELGEFVTFCEGRGVEVDVVDTEWE